MLSSYIRETAELKHNFWTEPQHSCSRCAILVEQVFCLCWSSHGCVPSTPFYCIGIEEVPSRARCSWRSGWCFLKRLSVPSAVLSEWGLKEGFWINFLDVVCQPRHRPGSSLICTSSWPAQQKIRWKLTFYWFFMRFGWEFFACGFHVFSPVSIIRGNTYFH